MKKIIIFLFSFWMLVFNSNVLAVAAPNFELRSLQGGVKSLSDYKGKVVLLDFWASWCIPCRLSFPWMNKMQKKYQAQGFEVVTINLDKDPKELNRFLAKYSASFTVLLDEKGITPEHYSVVGMPTSFLLSADGEIVARHIGFKQSKTQDYEAQIKQELSQ